MLVFNNKGKCIKIDRKTFEDIKFIYKYTTCTKVAEENLSKYLVYHGYKLSDRVISNLLSAVVYEYKYLKIKDE